MRRWIAVLACLLYVATVVTARAPQASGSQRGTGSPKLFEGARLLVGDGTIIQDSAFLVENGKITAVGRKGEFSLPAGAVSVDLTGQTVIPALLDLHVHLGYEKFVNKVAENYTRENVIDHLNRYGYYGVGAVFSPGTDPVDLVLQLQRDQRAGHVGGARLLFAAGMAGSGGGPGSMLPLVRVTGAVYGTGDETEARRHVRDVAAKGVKFIKIWVDDRGGTQEKLKPSVYRAIIDEAHNHGVQVVAHPSSAADSKDLLRSGVDALVHLRDGVDDEFVALAKQRNVWIVPTANVSDRAMAPGEIPWFKDPLLQETFRQDALPQVNKRLADALAAAQAATSSNPTARAAAREETANSLMKLVAEGVRVVLGTDAGGQANALHVGYAVHLALEHLVELGMTPTQAIMAATKTAAEIIGLAEMGTVTPGKSADFVVLDANPLDDIANTRRIARVYLRGEEVDRAGMRAAWRGTSN